MVCPDGIIPCVESYIETIPTLSAGVLSYFIIALSALLIYPLFIMYRGYRLTKSNDYLILLSMFLVFPVHYLTWPFHDFTTVFWRVWYVLILATTIFIADILHALRLRWQRPPIWSLVLLGFVTLSFDVIGVAWAVNPSILPFNFFVFFEPLRFMIGVAILYSYTTFKRASNDKATREIVILWQIFGVAVIWAGISFFLVNLPNAPEYGFFIKYGASIQNIYMMAMLFYVAVRYPQYLLISESQVHRACNLYKLVHVYEEEDAFKGLGLVKMKNYIESIPIDIFGEDCKTSPETETVREEPIPAT